MNASAMHNRWIRFAVVIAGWIFLGFVLSIEVYFNHRAGNRMGSIDFIESSIPQFGRAIMWALMAPLILRMRRLMPLRRGKWVGGVSFHLLMSFVVMATYYLGRMLSYLIFHDEPLADFWTIAVSGFYGRNIIDMAYYWAVLAFGYSFEIYQRYKSEELKAVQLESRLIETELKAAGTAAAAFPLQYPEHHCGARAGKQKRRGRDADRAVELTAANVARQHARA